MRHTRVAIIGAGFGGLGMAIQLKSSGMEDFLVFERASGVGGVWRDNRYPGAACDVQSHLYSFSFAPNPNWSRRYSPQPEIWSYLERCAADFGILPHLLFEHEVQRAEWDETDTRWRVETSQGAYTAELLVAAPGALSEPHIPALPGLEGFTGRAFHTARWPEGLDLSGLRVAVIGTGASAIQVVPAIQPFVERLILFQRTPPWVVPRHDRPLSRYVAPWLRRTRLLQRLARNGIYGTREMVGVSFRHPRLAKFTERSARRHLRQQIPDPALRRMLRPDYLMGCKRVLVSDDYYPALMQPNVLVVTQRAARVTAQGVVGADGIEYPVDVIVFGTGFEVTEFPFARLVHGRNGRSLSAEWGGSPRAHLGTTVAGFPNLFILQGPNTGLGHTSVLLMIEAQIKHILGAIRYMDARGVAAVEPSRKAQAAFVSSVDRKMASTVWIVGGCQSWYLDETGRNSTLWPGSVRSFRRRVERFRPDEYHLEVSRKAVKRAGRERIHG